MAFEQKTWTDRLSEYPNRRQLTKSDGTTEIVEVARLEGTISQEGDAFSAENMNDLEQRVADGFSNTELDFSKASSDVQDLKTFLQKALEKLFPAHVSIPVLSATTDKIIYSSYHTSYPPYQAFDGNDSTSWAANVLTYQYIGYDFENPVAIIRATFVQRYTTAYGMNGYKIQASNDKETWIDMTEQTNGPANTEEHTITFNEKLEQYRYWRLYINASKNASSVYPGIASLNFYNYI